MSGKPASVTGATVARRSFGLASPGPFMASFPGSFPLGNVRKGRVSLFVASLASRGGRGSAHDGRGARLYLVDDADLAGLAIGVLVLAEIFLRERIDMGIGPGLGDARDPPPDLNVAIGVVGV